MRTLPLAAAVAAAVGGTSAVAAPPTAPSDLRVDVYSDTAAELFWSRSTDPDGAVRGYEIRRGGELLDTRDGLSYFTDGLSPGLPFSFTVTAVDFDGERSEPARVRVVGGDREGAVGSEGGRPPPPANLRAQAYSSSAAELFWDRADRRGLTYEVSRNGRTVATTDGTSAFLSGLPRTDGVTFDVVAIDSNGRRSGAATVTLGGDDPSPPGPGGDAPAAPSNLRAEVYSSSAGEVFWDRVSGTRLEYEVSLDGEVAATTTGTSYFVRSRPGIGGTRVEVVAIGPDGTRSAASSTTLGGTGGESLSGEIAVRLSVYGPGAYELFWERVPVAVRYVLSRDGSEVQASDAVSHFAGTGDAPPRADYTLLALSRTGETLRRTRFEVDLRGPPELTVVGDMDTPSAPASDELPATVERRLSTLFRVVGGDAFDTLFAVGARLDALIAGGELSRTSAPFPDPLPSTPDGTYACPRGGLIQWREAEFSGTRTFDMRAAACATGPWIVNGDIDATVLAAQGSTRAASRTWSPDGYALTDTRTGSTTRIDSGSATVRDARDGATGARGQASAAFGGRGVSEAVTSSGYAAGAVLRSVPSRTTPEADGSNSLELSVENLNGGAGLNAARVETTRRFRRDEGDANYRTGVLRLTDATGFVYDLDADSGDPDTFLLTVRENGSATSYVVPWSVAFGFDRFDPDTIDVGF